MSKENPQLAASKNRLTVFFDQIGELTKIQRLWIGLVTFALIGGSYYFFIFMPKHKNLKNLKTRYQTRLNKLAVDKKRASQIVVWEKKMARIQDEFNTVMKTLPEKRELPSLLADISKAGSDAGLDFHLFRPEAELSKDFYKEIPVSIKVAGTYHQMIDFFFQIERLNRIVNISDVSIKKDKEASDLEMNCKAVTYMFIETKETQKKKQAKKQEKIK